METPNPSKFERALLSPTEKVPDSDARVCVRKPNNDRPIRVHPDEAYSPRVWLMSFRSTGDPPLLVLPDIATQLTHEPTISPHRLYLSMDSLQNLFFWPVKDTAKTNSWQKSEHQHAVGARQRWVRVAPKFENARYEEVPCATPNTDPTWPEKSLFTLLEEAFGIDVIERMDDSRLTMIRGKEQGTP